MPPVSRPQPPILVAIPTRDRPDDLDRCLASLTAVEYPNWSILVIDQSADDRSRLVIERRRAELPTALTYRPMRACGLSRARNRAINLAGDRIIAYLDDDCTVQPNWLRAIAAAYRSHPAASVLFGSVFRAPELLGRAGIVPDYTVQRDRIYGKGVDGKNGCGIGAAMCVWPARQRRPLQFDIYLGPGAPFFGSEETEYAARVAAAGETVLETPDFFTFHHGIRPAHGPVARRYHRHMHIGIGAAHAKRLRAGEWGAVAVIWHWLRYLAPRHGHSIDAFGCYLAGLCASLRFAVDADGLFAPRTESVRCARRGVARSRHRQYAPAKPQRNAPPIEGLGPAAGSWQPPDLQA